MPIYEYHCRSCCQDFETLVRGTEQATCVHCESAELDKKLSVFASPGAEPAAPVACGACGHPGGPGACALN